MQAEDSEPIGLATRSEAVRRTNVRWLVLAILFLVTLINYADRSSISLAGPSMAKDLGLSPVQMGIIFSAFGWAYVMFQLPGGWLLDKFGSKLIYTLSIFFWSLFTLMTGLTALVPATMAVIVIFSLRFLVGAAESPSFPANSRIVSSWFPTTERGTAAAIFNSAQYGSTVLFAPLMGWLAHTYGWHAVFTVLGLIGIVVLPVFLRVVRPPKQHPWINEGEMAHITEGGAVVDMDNAKDKTGASNEPKWRYLKQLLSSRMMLGTYIAQYCLNAIGFFFITWFPIYLVQEKHMTIMKAGFVAAIPAVCGFIGGLMSGVFSDWLIRRGVPLSMARKIPIIGGMCLCCVMVLCNYTDSESAVIFIMALSFLGKGIGGMGWTINTDTAPKEMVGLSGALLNTFSNASSITTPIAAGFILQLTGSFNGVLWFVIAHAVAVIFCYGLVVGKIQRFELKKAD